MAGLLKAYLGLSSALFAQLYDAFIPQDMKNRAAGFVLLCAVGGGAVAVLMTPLVVKISGSGDDQHGSGSSGSSGNGDAAFRAAQFRRLTGAVAALVVWVVLAATLNDPQLYGAELPRWINWALTGGMLIALLSPWWGAANSSIVKFHNPSSESV